MSLGRYLEESEEAETEEEFWADLERRSGDALLAQIILDKVAEERGVSLDQNDLTQHIIRKAQQEGTTPQQIADHLQEHPHHIDEYMQEIRRGQGARPDRGVRDRRAIPPATRSSWRTCRQTAPLPFRGRPWTAPRRSTTALGGRGSKRARTSEDVEQSDG